MNQHVRPILDPCEMKVSFLTSLGKFLKTELDPKIRLARPTPPVKSLIIIFSIHASYSFFWELLILSDGWQK